MNGVQELKFVDMGGSLNLNPLEKPFKIWEEVTQK